MSDLPPVSTFHAARLLAGLRLRRLFNMAMQPRKPKRPDASRQATAPKKGGWVLSLFIALAMTFSFGFMSHGIVLNMHCQLSPDSACAAQVAELVRHRTAAAELAQGRFDIEVKAGLALLLTLLSLAALLVPLGSRELAQPDWDLEWLVTLPMQRKALLWARVLERAVTNPTGWLMLLPACVVIAWLAGLRWTAPFAALGGTFALLTLTAMLQTLADTGLRLRLPPSQLRNLQALFSLVAMPVIYLAIALSLPGGGITMGWARAWPTWTLWTPPGLVLQALEARSLPAALGWFALLLAQVAVLLSAGIALLARQLEGGVVTASSRESARSEHKSGTALRELPGTPLQRRELRLLGRDRTFLVQSLLVPIVIIGSQMFFMGRVSDMAQLGRDQVMLATIAFGLGSYVLLLSAFQTINTEGQSLWMLYTFPHSLERMLVQKAQLWAVLALAYPLAVFGIGIGYSAQVDGQLVARMALVMLAMPIFALIAVALGVWASNPLEQEVRSRIKPTYVYLYSLLAAMYGFALYTKAWSHRIAIVVLMIALALALWQKARDHLPYLLDPTAAPPPRVSAADGLVAALLFFIVQAITLVAIHRGKAPPSLAKLAIALAVAGAVVYGLMRFFYWRRGTTGIPVFRHGPLLSALMTGFACALPAIIGGVLWLLAVRHFGIKLPNAGTNISLWLLLLIACVAAPLCEEFIFRGLLFGGLRRSMPRAAAMAASAALFAVVHPPLSIVPVFVLGLCTAYAYERNRSLLAPAIAHAVYNGAMIAVQLH